MSDAANGTVVADAVKLVRDNTAETDNERVAFTHGYDPNGNLTALSDASPGSAVDSYAVTYDQLNRVDVVQEKLGATVKHTTNFDYDPNSNITRRTHDTAVDTYTYNTRDLIDQVTNTEPGTATKTSTFTYTTRGQLLRQTKPNGNAVTNTYFGNGALQHSVEKKSDNTTVIAEHTLGYDPNGNRTIDAARLQNADDHAAMLNRTSTYTYDPRDRVATVTNTGIGPTPATETYIHDANNNVISQTVKSQTTTFGYDRNRLQTSTTAGTSASYNYDPFGRLDTITAAGVVQASYTYDGFDRTTRQTSRESGTDRVTLNTYDPLDRTASRTENAGTTDAKTTAFAYLGLTDQLLTELVGGQTTKTYQYSPSGVRLSQTTRETSGTSEDAFYGYNPHTDVEQLTTNSGDTKATYGYTAYGTNDTTAFTGIDKPGAGDPTSAEPYNVYRYNAKRLNPATGDYDMGFRDYNPALNRFLSRDTYNGATADMGLMLNPYTGNRYAYGAGNPISMVEIDGHSIDCSTPDGFGCGMSPSHDRDTGAGYILGGTAGTADDDSPTVAERVGRNDRGWYERAADAVHDEVTGHDAKDDYSDFIAETSKRAGIDPRLLMGIVETEGRMRQKLPLWNNGDELLIPLQDAGVVDGISIGMTSIQQQVFNSTLRNHPDAFRGEIALGMGWKSVSGNDKLSIKVTAYHLRDLQDALPLADTESSYTRDELVAYGYNAGRAAMLDFEAGRGSIPLAVDYISRYRTRRQSADQFYCHSLEWRCR